MPFVVEISVAFSVLIAFIVIGIFLFRIRERFDTVDIAALDRYRGEHGRSCSIPPCCCSPFLRSGAAVLIGLAAGQPG